MKSNRIFKIEDYKISDNKTPLVITGAPGSGKTTNVIERLSALYEYFLTFFNISGLKKKKLSQTSIIYNIERTSAPSSKKYFLIVYQLNKP